MHKKILAGLMSLIVMCFSFASCTEKPPQTSHVVQYSKDGKDSVVNVTYVDQQGHQSNFILQYMMFRTLFGSGGYNSCYSYYRNNPNRFTTNYRNYSTYSSHDVSYSSPPDRLTKSNNETSNTSLFSNRGSNSPSRTSSSGGNSPSRSWSSSGSSSNSPSRSSSGYNSPSRSSYSSSSSSPSRSSYSSSSISSRSYSSPSRR